MFSLDDMNRAVSDCRGMRNPIHFPKMRPCPTPLPAMQTNVPTSLDRANPSNGRAKLFLSCGQNPEYHERDWGEKVANALGVQSGLGFHVFFAPRVQDNKSLTEIIFRELRDSDYYVLIDFKRERLVPPFKTPPFFRRGRFKHRGSLFSHQEFALACYLGLDLAPFREAGVEPLTGVVGAVMGNAIELRIGAKSSILSAPIFRKKLTGMNGASAPKIPFNL